MFFWSFWERRPAQDLNKELQGEVMSPPSFGGTDGAAGLESSQSRLDCEASQVAPHESYCPGTQSLLRPIDQPQVGRNCFDIAVA